MNLFYKRSTLYILLISTVIVAVLMLLQGSPMKATGAGILSLEFASTKMAVDAVMETWEESSTAEKDIIKVAINNTRLDFIFLLCYSLFLFTCAKQLSVYFSSKKLFHLMAALALLAGLLDIVENIGMLQSLDGNVSDKIAFLTAVAAYFKWVLVIVVISFLIVSFSIKLMRREK